MKSGFLLSLILIASLLVSGCLADIRPAFVKDPSNDSIFLERKGRALLSDVANAYGFHMWQYVNRYELDFEDEFKGLMGKMVNPYNSNPQKMTLSFNARNTDGKMDFAEPIKKYASWIYENGKASVINASGESVSKQQKKAKFWIPTYQYFIEFPFKIQEANTVTYAGTAPFEGEDYELVLASWNSVAPQKDIDQYLLWIHPESKQVRLVEFTIREQAGFAKGMVLFNDLIEKNGILFPQRITSKQDKDKGTWLHEMRMSDIRFVDQETPDLLDYLNMDVKQIIIHAYYDMTDESLSKRTKITEERAIRRFLQQLQGFPSAGNSEIRFKQGTERFVVLLRGLERSYELKVNGGKIMTPVTDGGSYISGDAAALAVEKNFSEFLKAEIYK